MANSSGDGKAAKTDEKAKQGGPRAVPRPGRIQTSASDAAREIEDNLKRVYQARLNEPVPDRFADLLAQLRAGEAKP